MRARLEAGENSPGRLASSQTRPVCFLYEPGPLRQAQDAAGGRSGALRQAQDAAGGYVSYADALRLQLDLHRACASEEIPGILILLEHNPVMTMGVKTSRSNLLVSEDALARQGIELAVTDRGGDITYHGPGQLVGYPIIRLREHCRDVHDYLRTLEQAIIDAIARFGLQGIRRGDAGVWVGEKKLCSIGVAVRKWTTYHGFALNVDPNMSHFNLINPCGLRSEQLTSLRELLGYPPDMAEVGWACAKAFASNFGVELTRWDGPEP